MGKDPPPACLADFDMQTVAICFKRTYFGCFVFWASLGGSFRNFEVLLVENLAKWRLGLEEKEEVYDVKN